MLYFNTFWSSKHSYSRFMKTSTKNGLLIWRDCSSKHVLRIFLQNIENCYYNFAESYDQHVQSPRRTSSFFLQRIWQEELSRSKKRTCSSPKVVMEDTPLLAEGRLLLTQLARPTATTAPPTKATVTVEVTSTGPISCECGMLHHRHKRLHRDTLLIFL